MAATLLGFFVVRYAYQPLERPAVFLDPVTAILPNNSFGQREELDASGHSSCGIPPPFSCSPSR